MVFKDVLLFVIKDIELENIFGYVGILYNINISLIFELDNDLMNIKVKLIRGLEFVDFVKGGD